MSLPRSVRRWISEKKAAAAYACTPAAKAARDLNTSARLAQAAAARSFDRAALGKNIAPSGETAPQILRKRDRQATDWLRENDPTIAAAKLKAERKARKASRQAWRNKKLAGQYRKGLNAGSRNEEP